MAGEYEAQKEDRGMDKISSSGTETKTDAILDALDGPLEGAFPLSVAHERRYYKDFPLQDWTRAAWRR